MNETDFKQSNDLHEVLLPKVKSNHSLGNNLNKESINSSPHNNGCDSHFGDNNEDDENTGFHLKRVDSNKHLEIREENKKLYLHIKEEEKKHIILFYQNLKSGLTVGLVNLPLSISLAVASGSTPSAGILSGLIGGFIAGIFGGSNYNVVGPTGALSGFLMAIILKYGISVIPIITFITGIITFIVRFFHLENFIDLLPTAVNQGFTMGVALIIFFNQMNSALGIGKFTNSITASVQISNELNSQLSSKILNMIDSENNDSLIHNIIQNIYHLNQMKVEAFVIFIIFFTVFFYLIRKYSKIPWYIVMSILGIFIGKALNGRVDTLLSKFGVLNFQLYDFSYLQQPQNLYYFLDPRIWIDCMPVAFVAVLETLISAKIADSMTNTKFNKKDELFSLGLANGICGILGVIPVTAALARTALNIKSGGTYKYSSFISSLLMFVLAYFFMNYFSYVPLSVIAAQVCIVAVRMVELEEIEKIYYREKKNFYLFIAIVVISVTRDSMEAVIFGMLIYQILFCKELTIPWSEMIESSKRTIKNDRSNSNNHISVTPNKIESNGRLNEYFYEKEEFENMSNIETEENVNNDNFGDLKYLKKLHFKNHLNIPHTSNHNLTDHYLEKNELSFNKVNCFHNILNSDVEEKKEKKKSAYKLENLSKSGELSHDKILTVHNPHQKNYNFKSALEKRNTSFTTGKLKLKGRDGHTINKHFFYDIPDIEGEYIVYRIVGILNFMNVEFHMENIHSLNLNPKSKIIISLRYVHMIDFDAISSIKKIVKSFAKNKDKEKEDSYDDNDCKVMVSGLTKSKMNIIQDNHFIKEMYEHGALIFTPDQYLPHEIKHDILDH